MTRPREAKHSGEPGWKWRRAVIFPVVMFACYELHLLRGDQDTHVNQALAEGWFWLVGILVVSYAGFATFQDAVAIWKTGTGLPYATPPVAVDGRPDDCHPDRRP